MIDISFALNVLVSFEHESFDELMVFIDSGLMTLDCKEALFELIEETNAAYND